MLTTYHVRRLDDGRFYSFLRERFAWGGRTLLVRGSVSRSRRLALRAAADHCARSRSAAS